MALVQVYDPPMCCPTGVCGPDVDPELPRIARDLGWLKSRGVTVERFNLAMEPQAFVENAEILAALNAEDADALPIVIVDGAVVSRKSYPTRVDFAALLGLDVRE
jgi:arsenite methyltransferase